MTDVSARPASASSGFPARGVGRFGELDSTRVRGPVTVAAILTAVLVGLAVAAGPTATAILLAAAALLLAVGWPVLTAPRRVVEQRTVIAATGLSCALTVAGTAGPHRLVWLPVVVAVGMIGAFFLLLLTPGGRESLTEGMSGALWGIVVLASGACYVPLALAPAGPRHVGVAVVAVVVGALVEVLGRIPRLARWVILLAMALGGVAGWIAAAMLGQPPTAGLGLGMLVASLSVSARRVFGALKGTRTTLGAVTVGSCSVLLLGVVVLALGSLGGIAPT